MRKIVSVSPCPRVAASRHKCLVSILPAASCLLPAGHGCPIHIRPGDLLWISEICAVSARLAKGVTILHYLAVIPNNLTTAAARNLSPGRPGQIKLAQRNLYLLHSEKDTVRHPFVGFELLLVFLRYLRGILTCQVAGFLSGEHPKSLAGIKIYEGCGHDTVVHKL